MLRLHSPELVASFASNLFNLKRPLLLAIRGAKHGDKVTHDLHHRPAPPHDDGFVLLQRDAAPIVFDGSTHAFQRTSKLSPPQGVGSVRPGHYVAHLKSGTDPEVVFHLKTPEGSGDLPAFRDWDRDGLVTVEEMRRSEAARSGQQVSAEGTFANAILIHGDLAEPARPDGTPAKHRSSIGCWTMPRKWRKVLADACRAAGGTTLDAVLDEAWDIVAALDDGDSDRPPPPENVA
jgi:hypothetical protein